MMLFQEDILTSVNARQVIYPLGVVVEKRKSQHPWGDWLWKPISVFTGAEPRARWDPLMHEETVTRYHAGTGNLVLHRKETEAYIENLSLEVPVIYVILQESGTAEFPWELHTITASPFEAQDYEDAGGDIVEKVPMPDEVAAFVQAFVDHHHVEQKFIKRKRDKVKLEEQKFGKHPIFEEPTRH